MEIIKIDYTLSLVYPTATIERDGGEIVKVEFDDLKNDLLEVIDCYDKTYLAVGRDEKGREYLATAVYSCGELIELTDIQIA